MPAGQTLIEQTSTFKKKMQLFEDAPPLSDPALQSGDLASVCRTYASTDSFEAIGTPTLKSAVLQLIRSEDPNAGHMLNYRFEAGCPQVFGGDDESLPVVAARQHHVPAYVDILATLIEFNFDFDARDSAITARELVEARAPGLMHLLILKANLVSSGAWPDYEWTLTK